ncbi:hypothetical protein SAMN05421874_109162 [Nonomuraea maritima]|uniref:S9 family peptidase n=1 Tax=Nonomuraea maritima TaxID=683260 RepID=A0A1G9DIY6_9ACTN|nr:hypothetical protein [Nonomuraea maritima]SDK63871.1 hypothetical protein SAMN05421874_109162 [Nonomuraea maritima]
MRFPLRALVGLTALALAGTFLTTAPATAQTPTAAAAATYRGEGDDVVRIPATTAATLVKATHSGERNFVVWALDSNGEKVDLVANVIGDYKGTKAFNTITPRKVRTLEVSADGAWTLQVLPMSKARYWAINAKGNGSDVLKLTSPSKGMHRLTIRHSGERNFVIWALDNNGRAKRLLVNKIGDYKGRVVLPAGIRYATVEADGSWSITRS